MERSREKVVPCLAIIEIINIEKILKRIKKVKTQVIDGSSCRVHSNDSPRCQIIMNQNRSGESEIDQEIKNI